MKLNRWSGRCLALSLAIPLLSGCITTQERADGSTVVRLSGSEALGLKPANSANNRNAQTQNAAPTSTASAPAAPPLSTTTLAGVFAKHPYDGTPKTYFPRVALTIVDWSRNDCWVAKAKIWWSSSKAENVTPFSVCFNKQSFNFALNSAAGMHIFLQQMALEHSGNVRTEGPKPPMLAAPDQQPMNADRAQQTYIPFLQQIIAETGWKGGAPTNFWIVGYSAQGLASATSTPAPSASAKQLSDIERALSCRPTRSLDATLSAANIPGNGKPVPAPDGLKVFGLPVAKVAFSREGGEVIHFAYFAPSVSLNQVATAGQLIADKKGNLSRTVRVEKNVNGFLSASLQKGTPVLQCSIDYEQAMN